MSSRLAEIILLARECAHLFPDVPLSGVVELPRTTIVLALPSEEGDAGCIPIIYSSAGVAHFAWTYPSTLIDIASTEQTLIRIGHTKYRGSKPPSVDFGRKSPGVRYSPDGRLILDARWHGRDEADESCSGSCPSIVEGMAANPKRMNDMFEFASKQQSGDVACNRATHRAVAAGEILRLVFGRTVDFSEASHGDAHRCHGCGLKPSIHGIITAFRRLPRARSSDLLDVRCVWPAPPFVRPLASVVPVSPPVCFHLLNRVVLVLMPFDVNGGRNANYLSLLSGDSVCVNYVGSRCNGDEGWLYGYMVWLRGLAFGWFPQSVCRIGAPISSALEVYWAHGGEEVHFDALCELSQHRRIVQAHIRQNHIGPDDSHWPTYVPGYYSKRYYRQHFLR